MNGRQRPRGPGNGAGGWRPDPRAEIACLIEQLLGGLVGLPARARGIVGDPHRGNCLALHELLRPEEALHGDLGPPLAYDSEQALQLETFARHLARDQGVDVDVSGPMAAHYAAGEKLFHTRDGQVDIACHRCHDCHAGQHFRGQVVSQGQSQGQSNGFPV